jgi:hypothetical protein
LSLLFFNFWVQNALKLAYVHLSVQKNFPGVLSPDPRFKGQRMDGKREGRIRMNGRKGMGMKDEGERGRGGRRGKGGLHSGGWCLKTKILATPMLCRRCAAIESLRRVENDL